MESKPTRLPDLVLQSPHEANHLFHEDWTRVPGSSRDPELWEKERRLRDSRNRLIWEYLVDGRSVFFRSTGNSMWPLVQSDDGIWLYPIQAVTADGGMPFQKEASEIGVGYIVFCQVQRSQQYYAHIVLEIERDYYAQESKYWIGNIEHKINGWCFREHIFGILVEVLVWRKGQYYNRPLPKDVFEQVQRLVKDDRWSTCANSLCEPS